MRNNECNRLRAVFLQKFASVPTPLRNQIIVIVDDQPYTWESAFVEIKGGIGKSKKILEELKRLEIIK